MFDDNDTSCGPGSPSFRLQQLIEELANRFPEAYDAFSSSAPEPKFLEAIDKLLKEKA